MGDGASGLHLCTECGFLRKFGRLLRYGWVCTPCVFVMEDRFLLTRTR